MVAAAGGRHEVDPMTIDPIAIDRALEIADRAVS
jgi:hypothetical protein